MEIKLLKSAKIAGKLKFPSDSEVYELSDKIAKSLIEKGIAKDANEKETVIVKDETLSLEIKTLKEELKKSDILTDDLNKEIETLKEFLNVAVNSSKNVIPDGAEDYIEVDLSK